MAVFKRLAIFLVPLLTGCVDPPGQGRREAVASQLRFASAFEAASAAGTAAKVREARMAEAWKANNRRFEGPEFGGRIWRLPDGSFTYTCAPVLTPDRLAALNAAITAFNQRHPDRPQPLAAGACHPRSAPRGPDGALEVALWHTHPGTASFSTTDRMLATRHQLPIFLTRDRPIRKGTMTECFVPPSALRGANFAHLPPP